tara:strand:- start:37 stop:273 length:237 start_codon:yes stop_codon:yes gene_type:complete
MKGNLKMTRFEEQMKKLHDGDDKYANIWPNDDWTIEDYKWMFYYINKGYLVQNTWDISWANNAFVINEEWEGDPLWEE